MSDASLQESVSLESLVAGVADEFMERQRKGERIPLPVHLTLEKRN